MHKPVWIVVSSLVSGALVSCVSPVEHDLDEVVVLPDMHPHEWQIDLRDDNRAYEVSGLLADRMAEVELICPDGTEMDLRTWVRATNANLAEPLDVDTGIILASTEHVARAAALSCVRECFRCPDGAWVCQLMGPGCGYWDTSREEGSGDSSRDTPDHNDPSTRTPDSPRNAAPDSPRPGDPVPSQPREPSQPPPHL